VSATSSTNAWAVGTRTDQIRPLIEHWNGRSRKIQASPNPSFNFTPDETPLMGVAATSSTNAWAVGYASYNITPDEGDESHPFIEHWNGKAWKIQRSPDESGYSGPDHQLSGVAATSLTRNRCQVGLR
jgi:hypothetical protein